MTWVGGASGSEQDWNTAANWSCGFVPGASDNVSIPVTTYAPIIGASAINSVAALTIADSVVVTLNSAAVLHVKGNLSGSASFVGAGLVQLDGTSAQLVHGLVKAGNLAINNTAGVTIDTVSRLTINTELTVTAGTLVTNDSLVLGADTLTTSRLAPLGTSAAISGKARVMQTIQGGYRRYRFWGHPFSNTISLSQMGNYIDVTGQGGAANGFWATASNAPSVYRYNPLVANSTLSYDTGWRAITSALPTAADVNLFHRYQGIRVYMRGAKGEGLGYLPYYPHATVIGQWGYLNQGTQAIPLVKGGSTGQDYNLLSNPYASPVDLGTAAFNAKQGGNIIGAFYVWNPSMGAGGAFQAYPISTVSATPYYIQANTGFEVRAAHNGDSLVFNESDKHATYSTNLLRTIPEYTSLYVYDNSYHVWDMLHIKFDENTADEQDNVNDADKLINPDFSFYSMSSDSKRQAIDVRPYNEAKVIPLGVQSQTTQDFIIRAESVVLPEGGQLYLHDKLLNQYVTLAQGAEYKFTISKDQVTQGNERFELSMKPATAAIAATGLKVSMTPNPASDDVKLTYASGTNEEVSVRLTDLNGVTVYSKNLGVQQNGTVTVPLDKYAAGIYMVELTSGNRKVVQRLVKE